jgi:glycosyltransferase 2 family protein
LKLLKSIIKYSVPLAVAFWLLRYVYKDQDVSSMLRRLQEVDFQWIIYSYILAIFSNTLRTYRWNLLLKPMGYDLKINRTFLAVMVGYFANLVIPRAGEISKCAILKKTDNVNMANSIGTVVAERAVDLIMLILVVLIAFMVEFDLLHEYIRGFFENRMIQIGRNILLIYIIAGFFLIVIFTVYILIRKYKKNLKNHTVFLKIRHLMRELVEGFTSIGKVNNLSGFIISSFLIWISYYFMSYVAFFAIPETSHLGLKAGLSILAMSSLSMLAPVQGGIGAYHVLVTGVLMFYGISEQDGAFFAGLLHGSQVLMILVIGGGSFLISFLIRNRDAKKDENKVVSESVP